VNVNDIERTLSAFDWGRAAVIVTGVATLVLAIATVRLASATKKSADQTEKAVWLQADQLKVVKEQLQLQSDELDILKRQGNLQADQLDVFKRQLTLAEDQAREADTKSRPVLRALIGASHETYTEVILQWAHGSAPAQDIEVWVRTHSGLRVARHSVMTPSDRELRLWATPATADDVSERLPFEKLAHLLPQQEERWVGVDWRGLDAKLVGWSEWTRTPAIGHDASGQPIDAEGNVVVDSMLRIERVKGPAPLDRAK
jgi:hypothetical protein